MSGRDKSKYSKEGRDAKKASKFAGATNYGGARKSDDSRPRFTYLDSDDTVTINVAGQNFTVKFGMVSLQYYGLKLDLSARITQEQQMDLMKAKLSETEANARRDREELNKLRKMVSDNNKKVADSADLTKITSSEASWAGVPQDEPAADVEADGF
jgi:hypothetical protein